MVEDRDLVEARAHHRGPLRPAVIAFCPRNGVPDAMIEAAQNSPVYQFVKAWKLALPCTRSFARCDAVLRPRCCRSRRSPTGAHEVSAAMATRSTTSHARKARLPLRYMARLFSAGNETRSRRSIASDFACASIAARRTPPASWTTRRVGAQGRRADRRRGAGDLELTASRPSSKRCHPALARESTSRPSRTRHPQDRGGFGFRREAKRAIMRPRHNRPVTSAGPDRGVPDPALPDQARDCVGALRISSSARDTGDEAVCPHHGGDALRRRKSYTPPLRAEATCFPYIGSVVWRNYSAASFGA